MRSSIKRQVIVDPHLALLYRHGREFLEVFLRMPADEFLVLADGTTDAGAARLLRNSAHAPRAIRFVQVLRRDARGSGLPPEMVQVIEGGEEGVLVLAHGGATWFESTVVTDPAPALWGVS